MRLHTHEIETSNICSGQGLGWPAQRLAAQTWPVAVGNFLNNPQPITLTYLTFVIGISQTHPATAPSMPHGAKRCLRNTPGVRTASCPPFSQSWRRFVKEVRAQARARKCLCILNAAHMRS